MTTNLTGATQPINPSHEEGEQPRPQLSALTAAGLAILRAPLDVDQLCATAYEQANKIVDARSFHLGLFEKDGLVLRFWVHNGERRPPQSFPGGQDTGLIGWMRANQQPLLVRDFTVEMDELPAKPRYIAENPPRSAIFVPLLAGDEVVGSMSVQHPEPNAFTQSDLQAMAILANQVASAIVNARLFQTVQRRAEQLATIAEVSRAINSVLDLDELLTLVVELIRERFGYYHVQIFLVEDESHRAVFRASSGYDLNNLWRQQARSQQFGEGIIGWVAATGEPILANDVTKEPRYIPDDPRLLPATRSELAVPLQFEGKVLGVLDVQSTELNAFGDEALFVLKALANQIAVTVDGAWSYRAQQEEAWTTTVLLQVAEVVNRVSTLDDVLTAVVRLIPLLTGVLTSGVWLRDETDGSFRPAAAYGLTMPWEEAAEALRLERDGQPFPALLLLEEQRTPLELSKKDSFMLPAALWQALAGDLVVLLPLLAQNRLIGCLMVSLDSQETPIRLRDKRLAMLNGIANQTSAAIESVRLNTAYQEEAYISWALLETSRAIAASRSQDAILEQVVRLVPLLAGVDRCAVLLRDPATHGYAVVKEYPSLDEQGSGLTGLHLRPGDSPLLDESVRLRQVQRADATTASDLVPAAWRERIGSRTLMCLPLLAQDDVLGALLVGEAGGHQRVNSRHEDILVGMAQQVALALENFRLQVQERERLRLSEELQIAQRIQASLLPKVTPTIPGYELAHTWQPAREVGGDFYSFLTLPSGRRGLLVGDVADKGVPAALFMATSLTSLRNVAQGQESPRRVLTQVNKIVTAEQGSETFVTAWYGVLDPAQGTLTYANAGHSLALHLSAADGATRRLRTSGVPLGVLPRPAIGQETCVLAPGDVLLLYTDGVTDALDESGDEFGQDRLESVLFAHCHQPAHAILDAIMAAVHAHVGAAPIFDDMALVLLKRLGEA